MSSDLSDVKQWLMRQLPTEVANHDPEITADEDEILIILHLNTDTVVSEGEARKQAESELIDRMRHETRPLRIQLGRQINRTYGLVASWGMRAGETLQLFTNNTTIPVMTRLSREERYVLDTLIAANVVNTRSTALSYIVRTFAAQHQEWLHKVQEASLRMAELRKQVPSELAEGDSSSNQAHHRRRRERL